VGKGHKEGGRLVGDLSEQAHKISKNQLTFGSMHEKKKLVARCQQWVIDDMGKGHGKVGGQLVICQNKPAKAVKTKVNLPTGPWMNTKRTSGQASAVGC